MRLNVLTQRRMVSKSFIAGINPTNMGVVVGIVVRVRMTIAITFNFGIIFRILFDLLFPSYLISCCTTKLVALYAILTKADAVLIIFNWVNLYVSYKFS